MPSITIVETDISAEEAAAVIAAVFCLIAAEDGVAGQPIAGPQSDWRGSARLVTQGLPPTRTPALPRWGTIERLRRASRGASGVVGL